MVYETFGFYSSQAENPTPKRFVREHRGPHCKNDTQRPREKHREKRHSTCILCGPADGKVLIAVRKGEQAEERGG